jgi:uncharacterized protein YjgD (DUF1641 family)
MEHSFPWLPIGTEITQGTKTGRLLSSGNGYQLIASNDSRIILLLKNSADLLSKNLQYKTLEMTGINSFTFDDNNYIATIYLNKNAPMELKNLVKVSSSMSAQELLSIANAISEMATKFPNALWDSALYFPGEHLCLATEFNKAPTAKSKYALATKLLIGFAPKTNVSAMTIHQLNPELTFNEIRDFLEIIGFEDEQLHDKLSKINISSPDRFNLHGRPELEKFFRENILDYFYRYKDYQKMGIQPPNGILFYGPPGTGKTYTAKAVSDFLRWPIYDIDIANIGSPYIHQTSIKLKSVFEQAAENAPSIVLLEEIDALGGSRSMSMHDSKVEEISQLLRLIETASKQGILVLATTNRYHSMDNALVRKGRFDHVIEIGMPNQQEISLALTGMLSKKPVANNLSKDKIAQQLLGLPMSDVAWTVNEAARIAVRAGKNQIDSECFKQAIDIGKKGNTSR